MSARNHGINVSLLYEKYQKACLTGYCIRCLYGLLLVLRSRSNVKKTNLSKLKDVFFTFEHYQFAGSVATATATYAVLTHFLLRSDRLQSHEREAIPVDHDDNTANRRKEIRLKILSIAIAMTWFKYIPKSFRDMIVLHLFVRAVYDLIKVYKYDAQLAILPHFPHDEMFVGAASLTVMGYGIYHNPWIFDADFYRFILKWGSNTHEQIGNVFRSKKDPMSPVRLAGEAFVECVPEWHTEPSCWRFHFKNIKRDFFRTNAMYAVVHLGPLLVSPKFYRLCYGALREILGKKEVNVDGENEAEKEKNCKRLLRVVGTRLLAICRSGLFFVCVQHFSKLIQCYWRHYVVRADPVWSTLAIVYIASFLAECFETPQRRIQYTLYMSTQIIRMVGNAVVLKYGKYLGKKAKLKWMYQYWSVMVFQLTFAIWCYIKAIGREKQFCSRLSLQAINLLMPDI